MAEYSFSIGVNEDDIIASCDDPAFIAVYYKPSEQPQLVLRHRTKPTTTSIGQRRRGLVSP